jgi:hypothetical protein
MIFLNGSCSEYVIYCDMLYYATVRPFSGLPAMKAKAMRGRNSEEQNMITGFVGMMLSYIYDEFQGATFIYLSSESLGLPTRLSCTSIPTVFSAIIYSHGSFLILGPSQAHSKGSTYTFISVIVPSLIHDGRI